MAVYLALPALAALAAGAASVTTVGCGSSASPASPDASTDGALTYVTVTTAGGGVPAADAAPTDPFGSSSSSSGGGSSGGSGGGDGGIDSGSSSGALDGGGDVVQPDFSDAPYDAPSCNGTDPCDLRSNTCCLANGASGLVGTCTPGRSEQCPTNQATVHCLQANDCPIGTSCCGDIIIVLGQVEAKCVAVDDGGSCPHVPWTVSEFGVQLCKTDAECKNGQPCVHQACAYGAVIDMCGVQSASPLSCSAL